MLCSTCKKRMYVAAVGQCADCGGPTASMAYALCEGCSERKHLCQACRKDLQPHPGGG